MNNIEWKCARECPLATGELEVGFTLKPGYEDIRLFAFRLMDGDFYYVAGSIREGDGAVINEAGDDIGYTFDCIDYYCDITPPESRPHTQE